MASLRTLPKRLLIGRALSSESLQDTLLPKKLALPVFATDAISSVAYATQEIMVILALAGAMFYKYSLVAAGAVVLVLITVVASYRQNVHAYPSGGGDYEVAVTNLGPVAGVTVGSALMVDYVLTVAVSISSGVDNFLSTPALEHLREHKVFLVIALIFLMMLINLRGVRESGKAFALPVYAFMVGIYGMGAWALVRSLHGAPLLAESSRDTVVPEQHNLVGLAFLFLILRAFASGCTALTGIEAISNGVPAFRKPKSKNAASTLLLLGGIAIGMFVITTVLALHTKVRITDPAAGSQLLSNGKPVSGEQSTLLAQLAHTVFSNFPAGEYFVTTLTLIILVLAANTAFNGFPVLGSILARDGYLPRQLHTRGDRLAYSNGILFLAVSAALLVIGFGASTTKLIQLYIVGVFVSFTLSQLGMVRHWNRHLRTETDPAARSRMRRSRIINATGLVMTGVVLIIVLLTKFTQGAWIAVVAMVFLFLVMKAIRSHYDRVAREIAPGDERPVLPARNHGVVLVSKLHKPALRAVAYARATHPDTLTAVTVAVDDADTRTLQDEWERREIPVPLTIIASPYREITRPVLQYIHNIRRESPRDVVTVFIPEYVVGHWWEQLLHNQSALRLKTRLLFQPGVMVTNVAWQLESTSDQFRGQSYSSPGDVRRGREPRILPDAKKKAPPADPSGAAR